MRSVGAYTAEERAKIVKRWLAKRERRVWRKKIRYTCRKSLADRRIRVKGRFVKAEEAEDIIGSSREATFTAGGDGSDGAARQPQEPVQTDAASSGRFSGVTRRGRSVSISLPLRR